MRAPPRLRAGDLVALVAPASPQKPGEETLLQSGVRILEDWGLRVRLPPPVPAGPPPYLAGDDAHRAAALVAAWTDPEVKAVLATRGGYGCARLVPLLERAPLARHKKILAGFSDLTVLHLYLGRRCRTSTLHGPGIASRQFTESPENREDLRRHLFEPEHRPELPVTPLRPGTAGGPLLGGCLSLVVTSLGTPWEIATDGAILFLEDTGEALYRVDRMLTHLRLAGKLRRPAGVVLGQFGGAQDDPAWPGFLAGFFAGDRYPVALGLPCGHGADNRTLPLGEPAALDCPAGLLRLRPPA